MAIDITGARIVLTSYGIVDSEDYIDGTAPRSIRNDALVYWTNPTDIYMNIRVFCSESSNVSSSNYESYEDCPLGSYDYYIVNDDQNGTALNNITFTGLDPTKGYYFKAYALTGSDYQDDSAFSVNTDFYSDTKYVKPVSAWLVYANEQEAGSVNVIPGLSDIEINASYKKLNMIGVRNQFKFVVLSYIRYSYSAAPPDTLSELRETAGDKIVYESDPIAVTTQSDRLTINNIIIRNIPPGEYECKFYTFYLDPTNNEWMIAWAKQTPSDYYGGIPYYYYTITGANPVPTASWGTLSVTQTPGAKTANYSAALTRTDSYQNQFYIRIRIIDLSDNQYIATGSGMQVANSGSTTFTGTTTKSYTAGTYSFQFVAEWRSSTSDSWSQLMTANGEQLKKAVSFVVTDSGSGSGQSEVSGMFPLWSWSKQNNAHATEQQVRQAYIAITSQGMPSYFPYQVWNSLLYFVRNCIEQFGKTWWGSEKGEKYLNFQYALMSNSDKVLTAKRFMTLTYNILNISASSGVSFSKPCYSVEREPGEIVYGAYFISATNAINDVLTQINILSQS